MKKTQKGTNKMRSAINTFILITFISLLLGGCANRATATLEPSTNLASITSIYVTKFTPDSHGINLIIADKFKTMGYQVDTGVENAIRGRCRCHI